MFCPQCQGEFRAGFTRCGRCNVDLVEALQKPEPAHRPPPPNPLRMADYCGFFSLDDARTARTKLRELQIRTEVVIREQPGADLLAPVEEEYWIRVDASRIREVSMVLDNPTAAAPADDTFACSDCGKDVAGEESSCPHCGARFED